MKNNPLILTCLLIVFALACKKDNDPAPPESKVHLKDGLLLYLPFDGNMADSSGNGNPTTAVNGATLTYDEHGYPNSAFGGTGNGERIKVVNNGSIKFDTAFTISYVFMQRDQSYWQSFLSMVDPVTGHGPTFNTGVGVLGGNVLGMSVTDSLAGCDNYGPGTPNLIYDTTSFSPFIESWYHFVATYRRGTLNIYINGQLISTKTVATTKALLCPSSQVIVGGWWDSDPGSINGKLDEIRIYNRVLNADEIAELSKDFQY